MQIRTRRPVQVLTVIFALVLMSAYVVFSQLSRGRSAAPPGAQQTVQAANAVVATNDLSEILASSSKSRVPLVHLKHPPHVLATSNTTPAKAPAPVLLVRSNSPATNPTPMLLPGSKSAPMMVPDQVPKIFKSNPPGSATNNPPAKPREIMAPSSKRAALVEPDQIKILMDAQSSAILRLRTGEVIAPSSKSVQVVSPASLQNFSVWNTPLFPTNTATSIRLGTHNPTNK